jgi:hypothetical protein
LKGTQFHHDVELEPCPLKRTIDMAAIFGVPFKADEGHAA